MGTRALIHIKKGSETLTTIYRQFDGYPSGMGADLQDLIGDLEIVNGYQGGRQANGMGCLAAQIVAGMKDGVGNVYIYPAGASDCGEEYVYTLSDQQGAVHVRCEDVYEESVIYEGLLRDWRMGE